MTSHFKINRLALSVPEADDGPLVHLQVRLAELVNAWIATLPEEAEGAEGRPLAMMIFDLGAALVASDPGLKLAGLYSLLDATRQRILERRREIMKAETLMPCAACGAIAGGHDDEDGMPQVILPGCIGMCGQCGSFHAVEKAPDGSPYTLAVRMLTAQEIAGLNPKLREEADRLSQVHRARQGNAGRAQ